MVLSEEVDPLSTRAHASRAGPLTAWILAVAELHLGFGGLLNALAPRLEAPMADRLCLVAFEMSLSAGVAWGRNGLSVRWLPAKS